MIPKIIHYCWLSGDPFPPKIEYCIKTWRKILPDYQFVLWDTNKFPLDNSIWVKEAFNARKYAFAADYIRLYAVYHYGGIYLDSDVEVLKRFDNLLDLPYFIGGESFENRVEVAAFGAEPRTKWVKDCLDYYVDRHFLLNDGSYDLKVMPDVVFDTLFPNFEFKKINSKEQYEFNEKTFNIFPNDWFCANIHLKPTDKLSTYIISSNTYCIHHFANSWIKVSKKKKIKMIVKRILAYLGLYKFNK